MHMLQLLQQASFSKCFFVRTNLSLSLRFSGHFPGEPGLAGV